MPGFVPAAEVLLFRQKDPKPLTPRPASLNGPYASHGRAGQLATLTQKASRVMRAFAPEAWQQASDKENKKEYEGAEGEAI